MKILKILAIAFLPIIFFASCQKEKSIEDGGIAAIGSWQFTESGTLYTGNIDSTVISTASVIKTLTISGATANGAQKFAFTLFSTTNFTAGTYKSSLSQAEFKYFTQAKTIFEGDFLTGEFIVTITSLANNTIEGTFSGQAKDSTGTPTQILSGSFTSTINLPGGGTTDATGTLNTSGTDCEPKSINGIYTQGTVLNSGNTVEVEVNVATAGTYSITTNTINGVSFSGAGNFASTGIQSAILTGTGTPIDSGLHTFAVSFKNSTCNFQIAFLPGTPPPPPIGDYFPTTPDSYWVYNYDDGTTQDSVLIAVNPYSPVINGNTFTTFFADFVSPSGVVDTLNYRKASGEYFEALDIYKYFEIDESVIVEYTFLKDNVPAGTTYQSPEFSATTSGIPVTGYIETTIVEKAASATAGGQTFTDVIKVKIEYFAALIAGLPATLLGEEVRWYAKGVGLIYLDSDGQTLTIKRYQVN